MNQDDGTSISSPDGTSFSLSAAAADALARVRRLVVPTDAKDETMRHGREAALAIAGRYGTEIVLYDRTHEYWSETPHPTGPLTAEQLDASSHRHLIEQLGEFADEGAAATAFLATLPSIAAILDVLQDVEIDAVLMPHPLGHRTWMDRLRGGKDQGEEVARVAATQLGMHPIILEVEQDGSIDRIVLDESDSTDEARLT
jgi:hypothetical protein